MSDWKDPLTDETMKTEESMRNEWMSDLTDPPTD